MSVGEEENLKILRPDVESDGFSSLPVDLKQYYIYKKLTSMVGHIVNKSGQYYKCFMIVIIMIVNYASVWTEITNRTNLFS